MALVRMTEEPPSSWRPWAAAGSFVVLLVTGLLVSRGDRQQPPAPARTATAAASPVAPRIVPQPRPALTRAELIDAAARVAGSAASGTTPPATDLPGRRFVLRLPFGCAGQAEDLKTTEAGWTYDEASQTLRAKVQPQAWTNAPLLAAVASGVDYEAAEGFWIDRPWQRSETCPVGVSAETAPARQTLAVIELFEPGTKRAERRSGRAYEAVRNIAPEAVALDKGLRLVIEGRLAQFADGRSIGCWNEAANLRPVCAIRARFDRVAITDASGEHLLAEWTG